MRKYSLDGSGARYFPAIDGLRAVAVLSVLIYHLDDRFLPGGYVGVDIFFVISGFVVTASVAYLKFDSLLSFQAYFYARRIVRIVPALIFCLVVTALARTLFIPAAWVSGLINKTGLAAFFGFSNVFLALNTDEYFSPRAAFNPFVHTWSLGIEEQFYLIFPFLIYFLHLQTTDRAHQKNNSAILIGLFSVVSFAICGILSWYRWGYAFYLLPARFWELGCGAVLYLSMDRWRSLMAGLPPIGTELAFLGSIGLVVICLQMPASSFFPFPLAVFPVVATASLIGLVVAQPHAALARLFSARIPVAIGKISYSLYLWHWPVFVLFRWTIGLENILVRVAAVAIAFLLAILSYTIVERPARSSKWIKATPRGRVIAFGLIVVGAASVIAGAELKFWRYLTLSVTADVDTWYPDGYGALKPSPKGCTLDTIDLKMDGLSVTIWTPTHCRDEISAKRLFMIGDSHAFAYTPMMRQFALDSGIEVWRYSTADCAFIPLAFPMSMQKQNCRQEHQKIVAQMMRIVGPGDILFLPSLRLQRYSDKDSAVTTKVQFQNSAQQTALQTDAVNEAIDILTPFTERGAHVIFETPKPIFKTSPIRCSDWFNSKSDICAGGLDMSRDELQSRRGPIVASMALLVAKVPGISIWDPFPVLCPNQVCHAMQGGKPLFLDGDHLSGFGNQVLYPSFSAYQSTVASGSNPTFESR